MEKNVKCFYHLGGLTTRELIMKIEAHNKLGLIRNNKKQKEMNEKYEIMRNSKKQ